MAKTGDVFLDYVKQLKRHRDGRRAVRLKLSALERAFQQEGFRRALSLILHPIAGRHGGKIFILPNADIIILSKGLSIQDIETFLGKVRRELKESDIVSGLQPKAGKDDALTSWFDLETDFDAFLDQAEGWAMDKNDSGNSQTVIAEADPIADTSFSMRAKTIDFKKVVKPEGDQDTQSRAFDAELLVTVTRALKGVSVENFVRKQRVMAIAGTDEKFPALVHRYTSVKAVVASLLDNVVVDSNRWLFGYLDDFLCERLLANSPSLDNEGQLANSIRITSSAVLSESLDRFTRMLGGMARSKVIMEFTALDAMENPERFYQAVARVRDHGFRVGLCDIDPLSPIWPDLDRLEIDFIKVRCPDEAAVIWMEDPIKNRLKALVDNVGRTQSIFSNCRSEDDIKAGRAAGFTLFQGSAVEPAS